MRNINQSLYLTSIIPPPNDPNKLNIRYGLEILKTILSSGDSLSQLCRTFKHKTPQLLLSMYPIIDEDREPDLGYYVFV